MHFATFVTAAAEGHHGNAMLETLWFPIVALAAFGIGALVTLSYRDVSNRHAAKAEAYARSQTVVRTGEADAEAGH